MNNSKKRTDLRLFSFILALLICFSLFTVSVFADTGPKPSVTVKFNDLPDTTCIATLLGNEQSTGPWYSGFVYLQRYSEEGITEEIFHKFNDYKAEGWYFLGFLSNITDSKVMKWGYYPPETFRVLMYMPEKDAWIISDAYSRYTFDSYYTVTVGEDTLSVSVEIDSFGWIKAFLIRIVITIVVELIIALFFRLRSKRQIIVIVITNLITQLVLNFVLSTRLALGPLGTVIVFIPAEIIIFLLEALVYVKLLKDDAHTAKYCVWYSFIANLVTFIIGLLLPDMRYFP